MARTRRDSTGDDAEEQHVPTLHMPLTPGESPDFPAGRHILEAQQQAERDIASGAVDVSYVEAGEGLLPSQREITARAQVRKAGARQKAENSRAAGVVLLSQAHLGERTPPRRGVASHSRRTVVEERATAKSGVEAARATHRDTTDVLEGTRSTHTGEHRPGSPISPGARNLLLAVVIATILDYALLVVPILIEGSVVAENMHQYFRTSDEDRWIPFTIAAMTVLSLTVVPFLVGRRLGKVVHGAKAKTWHWILMGLGAAMWLYVGVGLAVVRVSVDRDAALDRAESRYVADVETAIANGQDPSTVAAVVPGDVFDPTLPTIMWLGILLGIGVALILFEVFVHNPARLEELRARRAVEVAEKTLVRIDDHVARLDAEVVMQKAANKSAARQWEIELEHIDAETALAVAAYDVALIQASGSPDMAMAIENRRREESDR